MCAYFTSIRTQQRHIETVIFGGFKRLCRFVISLQLQILAEISEYVDLCDNLYRTSADINSKVKYTTTVLSRLYFIISITSAYIK